MVLMLNGVVLKAGPLGAQGLKNNDMLVLRRSAPGGRAASGSVAASAAPPRSLAELDPRMPPAQMFGLIASTPSLLAELTRVNPGLANVLRTQGAGGAIAELGRQQAEQRRREEEERQRLARLSNDWWDPSAQAQIEEEIRRKNVDENMEAAMEHAPEAFGRVVMLYVDAEVNGVKIKAFVDSGAQMTIMSQACARRCGVMRLIDERFKGVAQGVGSSNILGKIHLNPIKIGGQVFLSSYTVLEQDSMDFLLGLDFLRKHQAIIDLKSNPPCLRLGDLAQPFLQEADLPESARNTAAGDLESPSLRALPPPPPSSLSSSTASSAASGAAPGPSGSSASSTTTGPHTGPGAPGQPRVAVDEAKVARLSALGTFTRAEIIQALESCGGNEELAAGILFGGF